MHDHVDYNAISSSYDERYSCNRLSGIAESLHELTVQLKPENILEVGCGTGQWLTEIRNDSVKKFGADISLGMLRQCKKKASSSQLICADANYLPFFQPGFDLIYCVNAIHHFPKKKDFIFSSSEILNHNGVLSITGFDPHNQNDQWYIYNYFFPVYLTFMMITGNMG